MGFRWPVVRRDVRGTRRALLTASALTALGAVALSGPLTRLYHVGGDAHATRAGLAREVVTFVTPAPAVTVPATESAVPGTRATRTRAPARAPNGEPSPRSAPVAAVAAGADSAGVTTADATRPPSARPVAGGAGLPGAASYVVAPRSPFGRSAPLTWAQRDSALTLVSRAVPALAATRRPTQGERDTLWREESQRRALLREQGRPIPIVLGQGSISLPLFSSGPSRERRARDAAVHRDNLLRLARLADRERAKRDSTRAVAARSDSTKVTAP